MKRMAVVVLVGGLLSGAAQAALHDRGGGLVYDDVLDVTWLADANYAKTSGYDADADGLMNWQDALTWATNLSYYDSVRGVTWSDWRLPTVRDGGLANYSFATSGTDYGFNVRAVGEDGTVHSELAYMYYVNLGFKGAYSTAGAYQSDYGIFGDGTDGWPRERDGLGPNNVIVNLQSYWYWSGTPYAPDPATNAWAMYVGAGRQIYADSQGNGFFAWAVRPGDVAAVPEPSPAILFGAGLAGLAVMRRRSGAARG